MRCEVMLAAEQRLERVLRGRGQRSAPGGKGQRVTGVRSGVMGSVMGSDVGLWGEMWGYGLWNSASNGY